MDAPVYDDLPELNVRLRNDGVALVTLDRPDKRNAMSMDMTSSWSRTMAALRDDPDVRVVVVTGAGSAFCAGGEISWIGADRDALVEELRVRMLRFYRTWLVVRDLEVPTIAAVNGAAVGAGLMVALACDLRYAADDAQLSAPFTSLGMHPGMGATYLLPQLAGVGLAREMLLTGRVVTAGEAVARGLVNGAVPTERVLDEALAVAGRIASTGPVAARLTKRALSSEPAATLAHALEWEALAQAVTLATDDLQEGLRAQREHRSPHFRGR